MAVRIEFTNQEEFDGTLLIYGKSGIGKTRLALTAEKPLILSVESGLLSLRKNKLPFLKITNTDEMDSALAYVKTEKPRKIFRTIVIDSITEIAEICLNQYMDEFKDGRKAYGELALKILNYIREFKHLDGYNIYMIAQQSVNEDEDTGLLRAAPAMPGKKLNNALPYQFDEVFKMEAKTLKDGRKARYLITEENEHCEAKDRSGNLKPIEKANVKELFAKVLSTD